MAQEPKNPDRHEHRSGVLARPDPELREQAKATLAAHGWTVNQFLVACLRLVVGNPVDMLRSLAAFKPELKKGRPAKVAKAPRKRVR